MRYYDYIGFAGLSLVVVVPIIVGWIASDLSLPVKVVGSSMILGMALILTAAILQGGSN